jgi:hypothetical protein
MQMSLEERIHELCNRVATATDADELGTSLGLLRAALHSQIESLNGRVADVIRSTPGLMDSSPKTYQRKGPARDYSAA